MAKDKKVDLLNLKLRFNDIALREMYLDIDDDGHLFDIDTETAFVIKDKFIKYSEEEYPYLEQNEIDLNLLENSRLFEILFGYWIEKRIKDKIGYTIISFYHNVPKGSMNGTFVVKWIAPDGLSRETESDIFINESLRIFHLICKINHRTYLYNFSQFNIIIPKK